MRRKTLSLALVALLTLCGGQFVAAGIVTFDFTNSTPTFNGGTTFSNLSDDNNLVIRWGSIANFGGADVDLVATVTGDNYKANNDGPGVALNGLSGSAGNLFRYARINLANDHAARFAFTLVDPNNNDSQVFGDFNFSVLDIDSAPPGPEGGRALPAGGIESVQLISQNGTATWATSANTKLTSTPTPTTPGPNWAPPVITASTPFFGAGAPWENVPNPTDPRNLTPEQVARTVAFSFVNTSSFELRLGIGPGGKTDNFDWDDGGRNFLFTGSISAVPEPTTALIWSMLVGLGMTVRRRR